MWTFPCTSTLLTLARRWCCPVLVRWLVAVLLLGSAAGLALFKPVLVAVSLAAPPEEVGTPESPATPAITLTVTAELTPTVTVTPPSTSTVTLLETGLLSPTVTALPGAPPGPASPTGQAGIVEPPPVVPVTPDPPATAPPLSQALPPASPAEVLISEFLAEGVADTTEGDEFVELCNAGGDTAELDGYKIGDQASRGEGEGMFLIPPGVYLPVNACLIVAKNAEQFYNRFQIWPDFEVETGGIGYRDTGMIPNLLSYRGWGSGSWLLANSGDELVLLGPADEVIDSVAYGSGDYAGLAVEGPAFAPRPDSLQRIWPVDTNSMTADFVRTSPSPGSLTPLPLPPDTPPLPAPLPEGMYAYWGELHAHSTYAGGAEPPGYALALARAAGLHFYAITDNAAGLSPARWSALQNQVVSSTVPGQFVALPGSEWQPAGGPSVVLFNSELALSGTDPQVDTLPELYTWLAAHPTVVAQFSYSDLDSRPAVEYPFSPAAAPGLVIQEIGRPEEGCTWDELAIVRASAAGWRLAPAVMGHPESTAAAVAASLRTGLVAPALTGADLLAALAARRSFATADANLALALRVNGAWMGNSLAVTDSLVVIVDVVDPDPEPLTLFLYDTNLLLAVVPWATSTGQWTTTVAGRPGHYIWVKVVQADGQAAYSAPVWLEGRADPDRLTINEILPAPHDHDWDGNGQKDSLDEWVELYNPNPWPVGLGGWELVDSTARQPFVLPLGGSIPAGGFMALYRTQTALVLNNDGDSLTLLNPAGVAVDATAYPANPGSDESWCRLPDGEAQWSDECEPSPGAANREKVPPGPLAVSIYEAKHLTLHAWVRLKGRVTAPPGLLGTRTMYIQDSTAGIRIRLPADTTFSFNLGDRVEVEGKLRMSHGEFEIAVSDRPDVEFLEAGLPPQPLPLATTSLLEPYEGRLVMLQGRVVTGKGPATIWLDDGTGPARTYLSRSAGITRPAALPGMLVTAVGIASQYSVGDEPSRDDYRLLLRYPDDFKAATPFIPPANWATYLPETGQ